MHTALRSLRQFGGPTQIVEPAHAFLLFNRHPRRIYLALQGSRAFEFVTRTKFRGGLAGRSRRLGWETVEVIDEDLGKSGGGGTERSGFQKLFGAICEGRVGAVFSLEASQLARNGRDWHCLLEFCAVVGTLIVDEDGLYDPRLINDRLLLGMKGTMSEMEVSVFRQRSAEAIKQKARRGELLTTVAVGYVKTELQRPVHPAPTGKHRRQGSGSRITGVAASWRA